MPRRTHYARRDNNEVDVINELKRHGYIVNRIRSSEPGKQGRGLPDLIVSWEYKSQKDPWRTIARGTFLLEIKRDDVRPSQQKLAPEQNSFFKWWPGHTYKATTPSEAVEIANKHKEEVLSYGRINVES